MAKPTLSYVGLTPTNIEVGATAPDPGIVGVIAWSTPALSPIAWNGVTWEMLGGGGGGIVAPYFIEAGDTFDVDLNEQILFTIPIELENATSSLDVEGILIEV